MTNDVQGPAPAGPPPTPELDKQKRARDEGHAEDIGAFLEWLSENGMAVCAWHEAIGGGRWYEVNGGINQLLARYFEIDLDAVERERRALLEHIRSGS